MPELDPADPADPADRAAARRTDSTGAGSPSRRSVLRVAAGAGAAGVAATALGRIALPGRAEASQARTEPDARHDAAETDAAATEPIVVHVRDASAGDMEVFHGTTQVRVHDRDLAARIVRASR